MKTIEIKGKIYKMYDSIDEMPIINFQKYNKYVLIDAGLGSDIDSVDEHLINLAKLIRTDMGKAQQELQNLRQNLHLIVSGISPEYLSFAALIHSVNGEEVTDLSDDNLKAILEDIKSEKHSVIVDLLSWVKKKLQTELELYFPAEFESAREKEAYTLIKRHTQLLLESIAENTDKSKQLEEIEAQMLRMHKPKSFLGKKSVEITFDKQFENSCLIISKETGSNAKKMTVLQYYNALELVKKEQEAKAKAYRRTKRH